MEEESAFPRGGASSITPLKRRQIRQEAQAEAERDFFADAEADSNRKRQKKGKPSTSTQVICGPASSPADINRLSVASYTHGLQSFRHSRVNHVPCLQALESQFVRKFAQEKLPAFVELLKFKVIRLDLGSQAHLC